MPGFALPTIYSSPDGWGPPSTEIAGDLGFTLNPINKQEEREKREKWGFRPADWANPTSMNRYPPRFPSKDVPPSSFGQLRELEEESGFTFVDRSQQQQQRYMPKFRSLRGRGRFGDRGRGGRWGGTGGRGRGRQMAPREAKWKNNKSKDWARERRTFVHRTASVEVRPTWKVVAQFSLVDLGKIEGQIPDKAEDLKICGSLETFEPKVDNVTLKNPVVLRDCSNKAFYSPTTSDDPVIRDIAMEDTETVENRVFATDAIMSAIMSSTRSVSSWDIDVQILDVEGGKVVFLDRRDDFELLPVNETSRDAPQGELATQLAEELGLVNQKFSQTVLRKPKQVAKFPGTTEGNPFAEPGDDVASALYRYRKWKLGAGLSLVCRCKADGAVVEKGKSQLFKAYALNEYDPKLTEWRKKLEKTSGGGVLANEIKNNSCTLAKWTAQALLVSADVMKLGYVARIGSNRNEHELLQLLNYTPIDFAKQIALSTRNMWGIAKTLLETCSKLPEGKYCLLRDPNKAMLHLYSVPPAEDSDDEDAEEGEEAKE